MSGYDDGDGDSCRMYEVEPGDTFYSIAHEFACPLQAIHDANPYLDVERLQVRPAALALLQRGGEKPNAYARTKHLSLFAQARAVVVVTTPPLVTTHRGGGAIGRGKGMTTLIFSLELHAVVVSRNNNP